MKPNIHTRHKIYRKMLELHLSNYDSCINSKIENNLYGFCFILCVVLNDYFEHYNHLKIHNFKELYAYKPKVIPSNEYNNLIPNLKQEDDTWLWFNTYVFEEEGTKRIDILTEILKKYDKSKSSTSVQ